MEVISPEREQKASPFARGLKDIAFGSIAGIVSKVFEHPFDLAKVRLQAQVLDAEARFRGPLHCLQHTWTNEGFRGLYRGLPAPVFGAMCENATLFLSYAEFQRVIRHYTGLTATTHLPLQHLTLAAAAAGGVTSFVLTPIELVKCKMQVQMLAVESQPLALAGASAASRPAVSFSSLPGPFAILANVLRKEGMRGLWLGQTGTFIRETGGGAAWFGANEVVAKYFMRRRAKASGRPLSEVTKKDLSSLELALSGAAAGVSFNLFLFPADSIKSMMQTEEELRPAGVHAVRRTFWQTGVAMWNAQGIRGLYAGCGVTIARAIPSSGMIFLIYDKLSSRFE